MAIKVLITRYGRPELFADLKPLLGSLRRLALAQPGYISGETLVSQQDPNEYLVISSWASVPDWNNWFNHPERISLQHGIDALLGETTTYHIYDPE